MKHLLSLIFIIIFNFSAFGQIDTISYKADIVWHKTYLFANCGGRVEDCVVFRLCPKFEVINPTRGTIDEYILIKDDPNIFIDNLSSLYQNDSVIDIKTRKIFVDVIQKDNPEIEKILFDKYGNTNNIYFMTGIIREDDLSKDWIYVLANGTHQFKLIDLKTNRVIEKIKLEPK